MPRQTPSRPDSTFATVKEAAQRLGVSIYSIRRRIARGCCPIIYSGDNVRVNVPLFQEMLEEECLRNMHPDCPRPKEGF